jgi:hypothetical protein
MHAVRCACCCTAFACVFHATACTHLPHCLARVPRSLIGNDPHLGLIEIRVIRGVAACGPRRPLARRPLGCACTLSVGWLSHYPSARAPLLPPRVLSRGSILSDASPSSSPCDGASSSICTVHGPAASRQPAPLVVVASARHVGLARVIRSYIGPLCAHRVSALVCPSARFESSLIVHICTCALSPLCIHVIRVSISILSQRNYVYGL